MLEVDVAHDLPGFRLEARFAAPGGLVALFGRSGAGKTTLVNILSGLIRPDRGTVRLDGTALVDRARGVFVPPHRRRIGYVFQEGRLFPHLSVRHNLTYGRWFTPRAERHAQLDQVVELLGIGALLGRRPGGLSGGEKQRVAIGRALLADPRLLLMDEPLASLDAQRKEEILPYVERLRDELRIPIVYVSHALAEVTRLATTLVVMSGGRVEAVGPVATVMARPDLHPLTGRFEAGAVIEAEIAGAEPEYGLTVLAARAGSFRVPQLDGTVGERVRLRIRARDVTLALDRPAGVSALNILAGRVERIDSDDGPIAEVTVECGGDRILARITRRSVDELALAPGRPVHALIKTVALDRRSLGRPGQRAAEEI